jgi:hypothetical protein
VALIYFCWLGFLFPNCRADDQKSSGNSSQFTGNSSLFKGKGVINGLGLFTPAPLYPCALKLGPGKARRYFLWTDWGHICQHSKLKSPGGNIQALLGNIATTRSHLSLVPQVQEHFSTRGAQRGGTSFPECSGPKEPVPLVATMSCSTDTLLYLSPSPTGIYQYPGLKMGLSSWENPSVSAGGT